MPDKFTHGLMLGEVLQLSKHTAAKVDVIEARQVGLIQRIDMLERDKSRSPAIWQTDKFWLAVAGAGASLAGMPELAKLLIPH